MLATLALAGSAAAQGPSVFCDDGTPEPCVESATVNGTPVTDTHPDWDILLTDRSVAGATGLYFAILRVDTGVFDLGAAALGDTWSVTIRTGAVDPRYASIRGLPGSVIRGPGTVTVVASPIVITNGCTPSGPTWTCPETALTDWDAYLDGEVTDFGQWTDPSQRESFRGYDLFSNIDVLSAPIEIVEDTATGSPRLLIRLANSHFRVDGVTEVVGFARHRIPVSFLDEVYGIDDPASLTSSGLTVELSGGGSGSVTSFVDGGAVVVDATGLSFSRRTIRIDAGHVTPRRPTDVTAIRVGPARARIVYDGARSRGSSITRHVARCVAVDGDDVARSSVRGDRRIVVRGLDAGVEYRCRVRAVSAAGPGRWSAPARLAPTPAIR